MPRVNLQGCAVYAFGPEVGVDSLCLHFIRVPLSHCLRPGRFATIFMCVTTVLFCSFTHVLCRSKPLQIWDKKGTLDCLV